MNHPLRSTNVNKQLMVGLHKVAHGIIKQEATYPLIYLQTFMTYSLLNSPARMILPCCLCTPPCMILLTVVYHPSFHFYWVTKEQTPICCTCTYSIQNANQKLLCIPSGTPHFLVKNNTPFNGVKFHGYLHHQNGLNHTLKPSKKSCKTSVF